MQRRDPIASYADTSVSSSHIPDKWEDVKTWRLWRNIMLVANALLLAYIIWSPNWAFYSHGQSNIKGKIKAYSGLNIRQKPSSESNILVNVPFNSIVNIINMKGPAESISGHGNNWYKVEYNNTQGWAWGDYIDTANCN